MQKILVYNIFFLTGDTSGFKTAEYLAQPRLLMLFALIKRYSYAFSGRTECVGIHHLHANSGTLLTGGLETGQPRRVNTKWNAYGNLALFSCCVLITWSEKKKKRRKKKDIKFDVSSSRRNKHIIKGVLAYISLSSHMCLPSKTYRHPHGFCGAEMNVTANKSKGKGLRFGGFVFTPSLFFCPDMTESLPNLEHNCLW